MDKETFSLNDEQKKAVEYSDGPLLVVAGAGTGKTRVIVEKIKYLINQNIAKPDEILALTFTEKAAQEMEERVDKAMPYGYFQMWTATFHSFADQLLRDEINHIGLNAGYKLLTQAETIIFLRQNLFQFNLRYFRPLGNPHKFLDALLQHFSRLHDEDIGPVQYLKWAESRFKKIEEMDINPEDKNILREEAEKNLELANAYRTYQELKIKEGYFDFSDLIFYLLELFRQRPSILHKYQQQFKYILVDEFQDTNISQYELIKLLRPTASNPKLTVVGDDSQAIYKFRGASVSNILAFMKDYPTAMQVTLNKNYRSHQPILDASYQLIKHNDPDTLEAQLGISKQLISSKGKKQNSISFIFGHKGEDEAEAVTSEILKLKSAYNYQYSDFAILVRANSHADLFITELAHQGIPYRFLGPGMLFKQPEIKDLIAYLKVLYDLSDSVSLYRVLNMDIFRINAKDINLILGFAKRASLTLIQACDVIIGFSHPELSKPEYDTYKPYLPLLTQETKDALYKVVTMINRHCNLVKKETAGQILYYFLEDTGILKELVQANSAQQEKMTQNITKFFTKLKSFESEHEDASVHAVVDYIEMSMELGESPSSQDIDLSTYDAVNILTVHASKGLEFPVVFLVNLSKGRFPTTEKREPIPIPQELIKEILPQGDYHLEEERRLFYVGSTRAMDYLYLTSAQFYGDGKRERKISPFVYETLGEEAVTNQKLIKAEEKEQLSIFDFKKQEEPVVKDTYYLKNFSFSQLESFNMCGLQYKYQYILKIPTPPGSAASFGDSIHRTLQKFYSEYISDSSIGLERLLNIYKENWVPLGYASAGHQAKMKQEGEEMLKKYFVTFHPPQSTITSLEKLFKIRINDDTYITGKIDRVDTYPNGEIEIIDYKTGKKPDEKELKKSLQLSIYAMAAADKGLYGQPVSQVNLTFYYLQNMERISMKRTEEDMAQVKENIGEIVENIRENKFVPKVGPWCNFCPFRMICEAW